MACNFCQNSLKSADFDVFTTYLISVSKARKALNADNSLMPNCYHRGDEGLYRSGGWMEQKF